MHDYMFDEIFDEANDLFITDDGDKSLSEGYISQDSTGDYQTEQAHHNDLEQSITVTERSSKFLLNIYLELLRVIKPLEKPGSYKMVAKQESLM